MEKPKKHWQNAVERGYDNMLWILLMYIWTRKIVYITDGRSNAKGRDDIVERNWKFLLRPVYVWLSNDAFIFIFTRNLPKRCLITLQLYIFVTVLRGIYAY